MAGLKQRFRDDPELAALVIIADSWLPKLESEQRPIYDAFLEFCELRAGTDDEKVLKRGLAADLGPHLHPETMASEGAGSRIWGRVLSNDPNTIYLNRALCAALQDHADDDAALTFVRGIVLHEMVHWIRLNHPDATKRKFDRAEDHGLKLENFFHGRPLGGLGPDLPEVLAGSFRTRERAQPAPKPVVIANELDGHESVAGDLATDAGADLLDALAFEDAQNEPILNLEPTHENADPTADRLDTPDYAHLDGMRFDRRLFTLDNAVLEVFCRINDIAAPADKPMLLGLRGADLFPPEGKTHQPFASSAKVREARYDHEARRCVLGVWNRNTGQVALYAGSTVPNLKHARRQKEEGCRNREIRVRKCNLLPTGCYAYAVGFHRKVPGAFRMLQRVVVLRSCDDLAYRLSDTWDPCSPGDNIHPTFESNGSLGFSSAGCQTVAGSFHGNRHTGDWSGFRKSAGLGGGTSNHGERFNYILVTAREMRFVRFLLDRLGHFPSDGDVAGLAAHHGRLRFGASGERVKRLQARIGAAVDGDFGPDTAISLIETQRRMGERVDGICTPALANRLGIDWSPAGSSAPARSPLERPAAEPVASLGLVLPARRGDRNSGSVVRLQQLLNRLGYLRVVDGDYGRRTADAVGWARTELGLDGDANEIDEPLATALDAVPPLHEELSTEGATYIGMKETGPPGYYDAVTCHPHFPGEQSGITIGAGYDLAFVTEAVMRQVWAPHLRAVDLDRLAAHCGKKGSAGKAAQLHDIVVPFEAATAVFFGHTLPTKVFEAKSAYPQIDKLHPLCRSALVSLVNNRGSSLKPSDRRSEMIEIADALESGRLERVPALFSRMKRHWPNTASLRARRDEEANLFRRGLEGDTPY